MSNKYIGQAVTRLDAHDKAMGRIKYTDDMCDKGALVIRVLHSTVANGIVKKINTEEAEKKYTFDAYMSEHAEEAAEADALSEEEADPIRMRLVMDYGKAVLENAKSQELTKKITGTVTVHKENDTWIVTEFTTAE